MWLYHRFTLSFRDVEDLLAERGVTGSYEAIRLWCRKFGPAYAHNLRRRQDRLGDVWHLDEVFIRIRGERYYLWRAVDQDGDVLDILVTRRRDARAAKRFFRKLLKGQGGSPGQLVTDKLGSYAAARRDLGLTAAHRTGRYENNRAEVSHQHSRGGNATCAASSRPGRRNDFWRSMRPLATHSGSRVIASRQDTIDCAVSRPFTLGIWRRAVAEEQYTHRFSDQNRFCPVNLTTP